MMAGGAAPLFCVAPMMRYSHEQARWFWRLLCPPVLLYTEMIFAEAVLRRGELLPVVAAGQAPTALQLGGGCAETLAAAARVGEAKNYAEINLNCGCPSSRVKQRFAGACLMQQPDAVAEMVAAMKSAVALPVSVKCRLAVDGTNEGEDLSAFVRAVANAGCDKIIVHARRALLNGLNPAQNRRAPPLNYKRVWELKREFPNLPVVINGGIENLRDAEMHLPKTDGVMLGRAVCRAPYLLAEAGEKFFGVPPVSRRDALFALLEYAEGLPAHKKRRALAAAAGLFRGAANNKHFRQALARAETNALRQWAA